MADPVKSDEIEDVLSSIRRLVTEHQPPLADTGLAEPAAADRLVLTPALRVADPEDPWVTIAAQDDLTDDDVELPRTDGVDWADEVWGDESAREDPDFDPQLQADIWEESETAGPEALASATAMTVDESLFLPSEGPQETVGDRGTAAQADEVRAADAADMDDPIDTQADEEAPLSFIRSSSSVVDYEPEEGSLAAPDEAPPVATLELAEARAAQMAVAGVLSETGSDAVEEGAQDADDTPSAPGEVPGSVKDKAEGGPDGPASAAADPAGDAMPEDPHVDAPETPKDAEHGANVEDLGESPFRFPDDDVSVVDEDALREIISDVVREELQGEMGKRITRNIRKLVRREIRIALASDERDE